MFSVGDEKLRVHLLLVKDHEDRRVAAVVHTAVIQDVASIPGGGQAIIRLPSGVAAYQHAAHKHGARAITRGVVMGVSGIPGEVASCG